MSLRWAFKRSGELDPEPDMKSSPEAEANRAKAASLNARLREMEERYRSVAGEHYIGADRADISARKSPVEPQRESGTVVSLAPLHIGAAAETATLRKEPKPQKTRGLQEKTDLSETEKLREEPKLQGTAVLRKVAAREEPPRTAIDEGAKAEKRGETVAQKAAVQAQAVPPVEERASIPPANEAIETEIPAPEANDPQLEAEDPQLAATTQVLCAAVEQALASDDTIVAADATVSHAPGLKPEPAATTTVSAPATARTEPVAEPVAAATPETKPAAVAGEAPAAASTPTAQAGPKAEEQSAQPQARAETRTETEMKAHAFTPSTKPADAVVEKRRSGGGSGGGQPPSGGGGGGGSPLQQRPGDEPDFRDVLTKGMSVCRHNLVTVAIFSAAVNLLLLALPIYLFQVSDRVLTSRSIDTLIMLSIFVVGAILVHVVLDMMRRVILMRTAVEVETKLGAPVMSAAARASYNGSSREFQALGDLQQLRNFITGPVLLTMFDAPVAPIYILVVFLIHPHLGFIVTTTCLLLLVVTLINQKLTAVPFARANAFAVRANLQADAMARNAQVINAMGMVREGVFMWGRETAESLKAQVLAQDRNILMTGVTKFMRLCTQVLMLGWGAWLAVAGELTGGMIIAASIIASRALAPIEGTIEGWRSFVQSRSAYARIRSLLQTSPLNLDRLRLPRPKGLLTVERVLYVPPPNKKVILNGVTFTLEPGESLAVVGPSGTGKSTLARMLVGSIHPTAGSVRLDMMDLRNWDPRQFGESVGFLPQDVQLFPASIKANIARMREDASDEDVFDAAELADVHEMISQFAQGYETQVAMDGSPLSGGQKQRIGLARAFFGNPRLVVLDEPNSNLDGAGEAALARALRRAKEQMITVVVITQRPALLESVDKVMLLKEGAVQAIGPRDQVVPMLMGRRPDQAGADPRLTQ